MGEGAKGRRGEEICGDAEKKYAEKIERAATMVMEFPRTASTIIGHFSPLHVSPPRVAPSHHSLISSTCSLSLRPSRLS